MVIGRVGMLLRCLLIAAPAAAVEPGGPQTTALTTQALPRAALALIDRPGLVEPVTGQVQSSYAHPIFWAPFSLVGDGG